MKNKSKLLILKTIFDATFAVSKLKLLEILANNDIHIAKRTLERHLKDLIESFFIEFSKEEKGYVKNELLDQNEAKLYLQYLNVNVLSQSLINFSDKKIKNQQFIISEHMVFKGTEHIEKVFEACHRHKELSFNYNKQYTDKEQREVTPLFLKEYQKRWYLIALDKNRNDELRTFGLDRIDNLSIGNKKTKIVDAEKYKEIFDNIIGLDLRPVNDKYPNPIKVLIKATEQQPHYFKSLPLHASQRIVEENNNCTIFEYEILINYEFMQHFNMYQPFLEIVEPKWLKDKLSV